MYLFGEIEKGDKNYSLLYKYIRNLKFGRNCNTLSFSGELNKVSNHNFSLYFLKFLCIISGIIREKILINENLPIRPTTDRAKEGIFNIIDNRYYFNDKNVLDLFSGLEILALSLVPEVLKKLLQ